MITYSSGPAIRVLLAGLLGDVSLASAGHLVEMNYGEVVHQIGLFNQLPVVGQIDHVIRTKPDLMILAGGFDQGAEHSQENNIEIIRLICSVLPDYDRPIILYAGNKMYAQNASENLSKLSPTRIASNIRPSYDIEDINPAQACNGRNCCRISPEAIQFFAKIGKNQRNTTRFFCPLLWQGDKIFKQMP